MKCRYCGEWLEKQEAVTNLNVSNETPHIKKSSSSATSTNKEAEIGKTIREAESQPAQNISKSIATKTEEKQRDEEFIGLIKSTVKENRFDVIPDNELTEIYNRAKSIAAYSNELDFELAKAINALLEEIKKRGFTKSIEPQEDKPQEIYTYKNSFLKQKSLGGISKWLFAVTIPIVVVIFVVIISNYSSDENNTNITRSFTFDLLGFHSRHKDYYGDAPLEDVAKDVFTRGYADKYPDYDTWKKASGVDRIIDEDNERRKPSFSDRLKEVKVPFPFRFSEESIRGYMFRYDRITGTVELGQRGDNNSFKWMPKPEFKNLEHVRDYMAQRERNKQVKAIEEQTEALKRAQIQQQLSGSNDDRIRHDVEDIKNTLEAEKMERTFQDIQKR